MSVSIGRRDEAAPRSPRRQAGLEAAFVFAAYSLVAVWWLWPLPLSASTHVGYFSGESSLVVADVHLNLWIVAWDAHAVVTRPWSLFDANSFYPSPLSLAYSEHMLAYLPLYAPTYWLTGNPLLATNLMIFLTYPLCGIGAYLLARRFVSAPAAAVAGLVYAFYPVRLLSQAHFQHTNAAYLPLALLFTERWLERARRSDAVALATSLALQLLTSFYLAYAAVVAYAAYLPMALVRWRAGLDRRRLLGLAIALFAAALPFLVTSIPYVLLRRWGFIPAYGGQDEMVPLATIPFIAAGHVYRFLSGEGVAAAVYVLCALALVSSWRQGAWPRVLAVGLIAVGVIVSFGSTIVVGKSELWSPYTLLQTWVPGFAAVRMPRRFLVIAQLGFALLAAIGTNRLLGWLRASLAWPAAVAASLAVLSSFVSLPAIPLHAEPVGDEVPAAYHWLAENGSGRPLLEIPRAGFGAAGRRMYLSSFHWLPIFEGYSAYVSDTPHYIYRLAKGLPAESSLQRLTSLVDPGWILVHRELLKEQDRAAWDGPLPAGLEKVREFGDDLLVRVTLPLHFDARERMFDSRVTLEGTPLAPLESCPGAIVLLEPERRVWEAGGTQSIRIKIENHGDRPWPGLGFIPKHLVRAIACLGVPGDQPCLNDGFPLLTDVPAHGEVTLPLAVQIPRLSADYELHVRLLQVGDGMLENCGVVSVTEPVRVAARLKNGPPGSYWESCQQCRFDGKTLTCLCFDGNGGQKTISTSEPCPKGYANRSGELVCE